MKILLHILILLALIINLTIGQRTDAQPNSPMPDDPDAQRLKDCVTSDRPQPEIETRANFNALLCGKAISLPKPAYPEEAKAKKIAGVVQVKIVIDEAGHAIWAEAIEGPALLREPSIKAACLSRHSPMKISDRTVKAAGIISYNFVTK